VPDPKPWSDLIPTDDVGSFGRGFEAANRPMSAGTRPALIVVDMTLAFVDSAYPTGHSETGWPAVKANATLLGQPFRFKYLSRVIKAITSHPDVWVTTSTDIADHYLAAAESPLAA
jgi:hypothetical protein